jgi:hypothetical protein
MSRSTVGACKLPNSKFAPASAWGRFGFMRSDAVGACKLPTSQKTVNLLNYNFVSSQKLYLYPFIPEVGGGLDLPPFLKKIVNIRP